MIRRIRLCNFKTHRDTLVEMGRLTVLVGPNGAGKTSILAALHYASQMPRNRFAYVFKEERKIAHLIRRGSLDFSLTLEGDAWSMSLTANLTADEGIDASLTSRVDGAPPTVRNPDDTHPQQQRWGTPRPITDAISSTVFLRLDARSLARPAPLTEQPRIEYSGFGLAAVIAEMLLNDTERLQAIVADVRRVVPQVRGLRVQTVNVPTEGDKTAGRFELLVDFDGARGVPAHAVSEGTLIAIGLLTLLHGSHRPRLILLDDIDQALHPKAQWELVSALRRIIDTDPDIQIVATTHSPYLVDRLTPDEVRVLAVDAEGITHCRSLSTHPRAEALLDVLSTGELLGAEGEDWVLEADRDD